MHSIKDEIQRIHRMHDSMPDDNRLNLEYVWRNKYLHTFDDFLRTIFDPDKVAYLCDAYQIGGTMDGRTIFWQIDYLCQCRSGKVIAYNPDGHRKKDGKLQGATWAHSMLLKDGRLPQDFELQQCLFGEHLLRVFPTKTVALVEAEKTAIICAGIYPGFLWLSVGGKYNFNPEKCKALCLRDVIVFPDTDEDGSTYQLWKQKASSMHFMCRSIHVSDLLERCATPEEKSRKIDVLDLVLKDYTGSHWTEQPPYKELNDMIMNNPF